MFRFFMPHPLIQSDILLPERSEDNAETDILMKRLMPDGRMLMMHPGIFGVSLSVGMPPPFEDLPLKDDHWYYDNIRRATIAFHLWDSTLAFEPEGWSHHPGTGRHRLHGLSSLEYIQTEGPVEQQVCNAVQVTQGTRQVVEEVMESSTLQYYLPEGVRHFLTRSTSPDCPHIPRCEWWDTVFYWNGRCVVYTFEQITQFTHSHLIKRLQGSD